MLVLPKIQKFMKTRKYCWNVKWKRRQSKVVSQGKFWKYVKRKTLRWNWIYKCRLRWRDLLVDRIQISWKCFAFGERSARTNGGSGRRLGWKILCLCKQGLKKGWRNRAARSTYVAHRVPSRIEMGMCVKYGC